MCHLSKVMAFKFHFDNLDLTAPCTAYGTRYSGGNGKSLLASIFKSTEWTLLHLFLRVFDGLLALTDWFWPYFNLNMIWVLRLHVCVCGYASALESLKKKESLKLRLWSVSISACALGCDWGPGFGCSDLCQRDLRGMTMSTTPSVIPPSCCRSLLSFFRWFCLFPPFLVQLNGHAGRIKRYILF